MRPPGVRLTLHSRLPVTHSCVPYNQPMYFVYMVRCADGTLYTGYTRAVAARVDVHNSGKGAKYTRSRLPVSLVYSEECKSLSAALRRERQLKSWSRARKQALISGELEWLSRGVEMRSRARPAHERRAPRQRGLLPSA